jgi:hypothetical protein
MTNAVRAIGAIVGGGPDDGAETPDGGVRADR